MSGELAARYHLGARMPNQPSTPVVAAHKLQSLTLTRCVLLDTDFLSWMSAAAPKLREIDVSGTPAGAWGPALGALCQQSGRLDKLDIRCAVGKTVALVCIMLPIVA